MDSSAGDGTEAAAGTFNSKEFPKELGRAEGLVMHNPMINCIKPWTRGCGPLPMSPYSLSVY